MSHPSRFDGVFTALITPFTATGEIDWPAFDALIDRQIAAGITGLVPVGTTGEAATLSADEADSLIKRTVERADGRAYVLAGTGSNSTAKTIEATKRAADLGVNGVLIVTPYYNKPSQRGLIEHFTQVAACADVDNVLYSVPGRAGVAIAPETAGTLAKSCKNIVAIKEAGGDAGRVSDLRLACGTDFAVHCGDDGLAMAFYALGACGLTSVFSNYDPEACVAVYQAWASGKAARALELHDVVRPIGEAMFVENSPAPVKHILSLEGKNTDKVRLPLASVSPEGCIYLEKVLRRYLNHRNGIIVSDAD